MTRRPSPPWGLSWVASGAMRVRVRLFAVLRERAGRDVLELDLPDGASVADALAAVGDLAGDLPLVLAVNREYAPADQRLRPATSSRCCRRSAAAGPPSTSPCATPRSRSTR